MDDLFSRYDTLPHEVQAILMGLPEDGMTYNECKELVERLEKVGYTCDYYLDAIPHNLRKVDDILQ